jgi:hypothetical protein
VSDWGKRDSEHTEVRTVTKIMMLKVRLRVLEEVSRDNTHKEKKTDSV